MNLLAITPFVQSNNVKSRQNLNNINVIQPKYIHTLASDTVSFTGGRSVSKVADYLEAQVAADSERFNRIATTYLDILESVAFKLKEKGFSFDRIYCEQNPVKSPEAYTSKVVRSGKFKVPDTIRASLYCNDLYNLDSLNALLLEMKKRGYVLSDTEMPVIDLVKRGYIPAKKEIENPELEKIVPDLDIRLEDISDQVVKLDKSLKYSIGKPQKSGYEDIQMRFVREFDNKKNPVQHELIILFGPNYAKAKHEESTNIYKYLRKFDELNVKFTDKTIGSPSHKANRYVDLIKEMFRGKVSQKLFLNAKNKDLYEISDEIPITFTDTDIAVFENYFSGLRDRVNAIYRENKKSAQFSSLVRNQLAKDQREDKTLLTNIHDNLKAAIENYNYQTDLKKT